MKQSQPSEKDLKNRFLNIAETLEKEYGYSPEELQSLLTKGLQVPATLFSTKLSPLQALVTYLHDEHELEFKEIASLIGRSYRAIWGAYQKTDLEIASSKYKIPLSTFNSKLSILESTVTHLRERYELRFSKIARLINRDQRTVWTVYHRAKKK